MAMKDRITPDVAHAIGEASEEFGIPSETLTAIAAQESAFNKNAKAKTSSATGLFQILPYYTGQSDSITLTVGNCGE